MATFTLDSSVLGGSQFVPRYISTEEGGEFRALQLQVSDTADGSDLEIHHISVRLEPGAESMENS